MTRHGDRRAIRRGVLALVLFSCISANAQEQCTIDTQRTLNGWNHAWSAMRSHVPIPTAAPSLVAYVVDAGTNSIRGYAVDDETGILAPLNSPSVPTQDYPFFIAAHPSGKYVYVANLRSNSVSGYAVDAKNGALRPMPNPVAQTGALPWAIAVHPSGNFAYVLNAGSHSISAFVVDPKTGALGAPSVQALEGDSTPQAIAIEPGGRFVYVGLAGHNVLVGFAIDLASGVLHQMPDTSISLPSAPESVISDANGHVIHVRLGSGGWLSYGIDTHDGHLTPLLRQNATPQTQPAHGGRCLEIFDYVSAMSSSWPRGIAADPGRQYAFVVQKDKRLVLTYQLDTSDLRERSVLSAVEAGAQPVAITLVELHR